MTEDTKFVAIKIQDVWLRLSDDGHTIDVVEEDQEKHVFPIDMAYEIIKALKAEGIEDKFELVPVNIKEDEIKPEE